MKVQNSGALLLVAVIVSLLTLWAGPAAADDGAVPPLFSHDDDTGDDYTWYTEGRVGSNTINQSYGVVDKHPELDLISASLSRESGQVYITIEVAGEPNYGMGVEYHAALVGSPHVQMDDLLYPSHENIVRTFIDLIDPAKKKVSIWLEPEASVEPSSTPELDYLRFQPGGGKVTFITSEDALEKVGADLDNSSLDLFVYCQKVEYETRGDKWTTKLMWDACGAGAAEAPAEYNLDLYEKKRSEGGGDDGGGGSKMDLVYYAIICAIIIAIIAVAVPGKRSAGGARKKGKKRKWPAKEGAGAIKDPDAVEAGGRSKPAKKKKK